MTVTQIANKLLVTNKTVIRWISEGILKAIKVRAGMTTRWEVSSDDLETYLKRHNQKEAPEKPFTRKELERVLQNEANKR